MFNMYFQEKHLWSFKTVMQVVAYTLSLYKGRCRSKSRLMWKVRQKLGATRGKVTLNLLMYLRTFKIIKNWYNSHWYKQQPQLNVEYEFKIISSGHLQCFQRNLFVAFNVCQGVRIFYSLLYLVLSFISGYIFAK